ncbi:MAG: UvrB/UvrC motif-containing protein, partial [Actinomycetota bacterium]|nr:UvrB/UvrC motif-containing protein [Actinomycetota bacterium]
LQQKYNKENNINPQTIRKAVTDILLILRGETQGAPVPEKLSNKHYASAERAKKDLAELPEDDLNRLIHSLELEMQEAAEDLRFEYAARLRDELKELRRDLRDAVK